MYTCVGKGGTMAGKRYAWKFRYFAVLSTVAIIISIWGGNAKADNCHGVVSAYQDVLMAAMLENQQFVSTLERAVKTMKKSAKKYKVAYKDVNKAAKDDKITEKEKKKIFKMAKKLDALKNVSVEIKYELKELKRVMKDVDDIEKDMIKACSN